MSVRHLAVVAFALSFASGCSFVRSAMPGTTVATGEAWYVRVHTFLGIPVQSQVFYCVETDCREARFTTSRVPDVSRTADDTRARLRDACRSGDGRACFLSSELLERTGAPVDEVCELRVRACELGFAAACDDDTCTQATGPGAPETSD